MWPENNNNHNNNNNNSMNLSAIISINNLSPGRVRCADVGFASGLHHLLQSLQVQDNVPKLFLGKFCVNCYLCDCLPGVFCYPNRYQLSLLSHYCPNRYQVFFVCSKTRLQYRCEITRSVPFNGKKQTPPELGRSTGNK